MAKNTDRFENHMDVSGGEMSGDAEKIEDIIDSPEDYHDEFESKISQSAKSSLTLEKAMTYVTALESIVNAFNNYHEAAIHDKDKTEIKHPLTSIATKADNYMESSVEDVISNQGFELSSTDSNTASPFETAKDLIEAIGGDEDEALSTPEDLKEERDELIEKSAITHSSLESISALDKPTSILAFSSVVSENHEYGEGGGLQLFIPNANDYKGNGILVKIGEYTEGTTRSVPNYADVNSFFTDHIEAKDDVAYDDEIAYLYSNTISEKGLNMVRTANGEPVNTETEDYLHPHSNQEDSNGIYYPDSWKVSEIKNGDILYQLSANGDTPSCYFTNQETVNQCVHDGVIDFKELRDKLQVANGNEKSCLSIYKCNL